MVDRVAGEYAYPDVIPADRRAAVIDLADQTRSIARRHPWLPKLVQAPTPPGPNALRYLDYFLGLLAGSELDTGAKLEVISLISGFATNYGAMQGSLDHASSAASLSDHASAQVQAFARAAVSGRYPYLAAALAEAGPIRGEEDVFTSALARLVDMNQPGNMT